MDQNDKPTTPATSEQPAFTPAATPGTAPAVASAEDPGKTLSIIGLVLAFFFPLIGLVLSIIGRSKSKKAGASTTLGLVGIILNSVFLVIGLLVFIIMMLGAVAGFQQAAEESNANSSTQSSQEELFEN